MLEFSAQSKLDRVGIRLATLDADATHALGIVNLE